MVIGNREVFVHFNDPSGLMDSTLRMSHPNVVAKFESIYEELQYKRLHRVYDFSSKGDRVVTVGSTNVTIIGVLGLDVDAELRMIRGLFL